jgi:hypothetical protein
MPTITDIERDTWFVEEWIRGHPSRFSIEERLTQLCDNYDELIYCIIPASTMLMKEYHLHVGNADMYRILLHHYDDETHEPDISASVYSGEEGMWTVVDTAASHDQRRRLGSPGGIRYA